MRERQTIPTIGPDTHVPSTPLVQDITNRGEYHRIRTVWLKSQADETLPITPLGGLPKSVKMRTQFVYLFVRMNTSRATYRPKSPSINGSHPEGFACPLILKHLYNTEKPWSILKNALGLLLFFVRLFQDRNKKHPQGDSTKCPTLQNKRLFLS